MKYAHPGAGGAGGAGDASSAGVDLSHVDGELLRDLLHLLRGEPRVTEHPDLENLGASSRT